MVLYSFVKVATVVAFGIAFVSIAATFFFKQASASSTSTFAPNSISLLGENPLILHQGDAYIEQGITLAPEVKGFIESEGKSAPTVSYEYSEIGMAFSDYLANVGSFDVEYTVAAPWFGNVKLTRKVIVQDVDECTYSGMVSAFRHTCSASQICTNNIGSFSCN